MNDLYDNANRATNGSDYTDTMYAPIALQHMLSYTRSLDTRLAALERENSPNPIDLDAIRREGINEGLEIAAALFDNEARYVSADPPRIRLVDSARQVRALKS